MPRRDIVLTGLIAFGAGVAVGANWAKLRKKIGLQMAELGDFLSATGLEEFVPQAMSPQTTGRRPHARRRGKTKAAAEAFVPPASPRPGQQSGFPMVRPSPKRKVSRRKPSVPPQAETPLANGTFDA